MMSLRSTVLFLILATSNAFVAVQQPHSVASTRFHASQVISEEEFFPSSPVQAMASEQSRKLALERPALIDLPRHTAEFQLSAALMVTEISVGRVAMVAGVALLATEVLTGQSLPQQIQAISALL